MAQPRESPYPPGNVKINNAAYPAVANGNIGPESGVTYTLRIYGETGSLRRVANLTYNDGLEFLAQAPGVPVTTHCTAYPLSEANQAPAVLRDGKLQGAAVLVPSLG